MKPYRLLLRLQGIFYLLTGIWPVLHIESFMAVTGPKTDIWLVKTVGLLKTACSLGMLTASFRKSVQPDLLLVLFRVHGLSGRHRYLLRFEQRDLEYLPGRCGGRNFAVVGLALVVVPGKTGD